MDEFFDQGTAIVLADNKKIERLIGQLEGVRKDFKHKRVTVNTLPDFTESLAFVKKAVKVIKKERLKYSKPLDAQKKELMKMEKTLTKPFIEVESILHQKVIAFEMEQRKLREEQARLLEEKRLKEEAEANANYGEYNEVAIELPKVAPTTNKGSLETEHSTTSIRDNWKYSVIDISQVPKEFLKTVIDDDRVKFAIKHGTREIKGLKIFNEPTVTSRLR